MPLWQKEQSEMIALFYSLGNYNTVKSVDDF